MTLTGCVYCANRNNNNNKIVTLYAVSHRNENRNKTTPAPPLPILSSPINAGKKQHQLAKKTAQIFVDIPSCVTRAWLKSVKKDACSRNVNRRLFDIWNTAVDTS